MIVYFLVFWLLHAGIIVYPGPSDLSLEGLWPAISIGIAGIPWRYYKRFSLFITSKRLKAPAEEVVAEEASKSTLYKEKIIKKETYKQEMTNKDVKKNRTKFISILKKIFIIIISLTLIVTVAGGCVFRMKQTRHLPCLCCLLLYKSSHYNSSSHVTYLKFSF